MENNTSIKSYDELIQIAKRFSSQEEQIYFVVKFLAENVKYDYKKLLIAYCMTGVKEYKYSYEELEEDSYYTQLVRNELKNNLPVGVIKLVSTEGTNSIIQRIQENSCSFKEQDEAIEYLLDIWQNIILPEMQLHTDNEKILLEMQEEYFQEGNKFLRGPIKVKNKEGKESFAFYDLLNLIANENERLVKRYVPEEENGLLRKGVCEDYSKFLCKVLTDLGIENYSVDGISELGHAWNLIRTNDGEIKSIDLTREVFIRDNYAHVPEEQKGKWILTDLKDMFDMQETRQIHSINEKKIIVTAKNYQEMKEQIIAVMDEIQGEMTSLKDIAVNILAKGIEERECDKSKKDEIQKKSDQEFKGSN